MENAVEKAKRVMSGIEKERAKVAKAEAAQETEANVRAHSDHFGLI